MPCTPIPRPDGGYAIVCSRGVRPQPGSVHLCWYCPQPATRQCDAALTGQTTCDRWLCLAHAEHHPPATDYCPDHAQFSVPPPAPTLPAWRRMAQKLDAGTFEVTDWEAGFLHTLLRWRGALTPKQLAILTQMTERYLGLEAAAELRGQLRLFTSKET